ncbi:MAG TPA: BamA/TamA family outer membrane protein, partial [Bryobacteraceae bacterium]|nr:BamA/TamA family outer membrane protein [Bryobacteraceae bacterium]
DVGETIDRMFATGRYEDIQVDAEPGANGVVIRFITRDARFVGHISVSGKTSNPPGRGQIVDAAELTLGTPFRQDALKAAQENIQQLFTNNGLYQATVHLETINDPAAQQVDVRIVVTTGKRARYEMPEIRGDTKLPDNTIVRATGWRVWLIGRWRLVTESLTDGGVHGIQKKYQSKDRLAADVDMESLDYNRQTNRVKAELHIDAGPKIQVKALEAKVSKSKLRRYVPIYQEGAVDQDLLVEGARNLRDYFQSKGYPDVDVTFRELPVQGDSETIEYFISRGPRQKLSHLEIRGNSYFRTNTIRERMFLQESSFRFRWGRYSEAFRNKDEETIANLYKSNGFRDVKVTSTLESNYRGKSNQIAINFTIDEGQQWLVSKLTLEGVSQLDRDTLVSMLSSSAGQPYSDLSVSTDRNTVLTFYYGNGFPNATFQWYAKPAGPHQVDLHYHVVEGRREFVRDVLISGLKVTRPSLVHKNLPVKIGDPLSIVQINEAQRRLYDLGIFARIGTAVQNSDGNETNKYVLYDFTEAHRYTLSIGVGAELAQFGPTANSLTSPAGNTGFSPRFSLDLNRLNFLGLGQTMALQTRVSNIEQRAALSYIIPRIGDVEGRTLTLTGLYDLSRDVRTFSSRRQEASVQLSDRLSKAMNVSLRFAYRRVSTGNVIIPALLVPQLLQPVRIGMLSGNLVQDRRDNPADPHRGIYNTIDAGLAWRGFGSQRTFGRVLARNATYYQIGRNLVLARQLTFGIIEPFSIPKGFSAYDSVPLPERFFGGGSVSDRGFPENQAGPRDLGTPAGPGGTATPPTGFPLGGNALLFNNVELRFPLLGDNIGGVLFEDAGNIYKSVGDISFRYHQRDLQHFNTMVQAAGFGIRYKTPVGPVRVDLSYVLNPTRFVGFKGTIQDLLQCNPNLPPSQLPPACRGVEQSTGHFQFFFSIGQTF